MIDSLEILVADEENSVAGDAKSPIYVIGLADCAAKSPPNYHSKNNKHLLPNYKTRRFSPCFQNNFQVYYLT